MTLPPSILFDLDGTLTDPFEGITRCIQHALRELSLPVPPASELSSCIGPPLRASFARLIGPERSELVEAAIALYRERFSSVGIYENALYLGVTELLETLRNAGAHLYIATSKPHVFARRIAEHFAVADFFTGTYGAELDGVRSEKHEVIDWLLQHESIARDRCVMIGDRHHDVAGAAAHNLPAIGVLWGYGTAEELTAAGARSLCVSPGQLVAGIEQLFSLQ